MLDTYLNKWIASFVLGHKHEATKKDSSDESSLSGLQKGQQPGGVIGFLKGGVKQMKKEMGGEGA